MFENAQGIYETLQAPTQVVDGAQTRIRCIHKLHALWRWGGLVRGR